MLQLCKIIVMIGLAALIAIPASAQPLPKHDRLLITKCIATLYKDVEPMVTASIRGGDSVASGFEAAYDLYVRRRAVFLSYLLKIDNDPRINGRLVLEACARGWHK